MPHSDTTECSIWSGSTLFATHPAILHTFTGSNLGVEEKYEEKCPKFIQNFPWKWNFKSKELPNPSESTPDWVPSDKWSVCVDAQAYLSHYKVHMSEGTFSYIVAQLLDWLQSPVTKYFSHSPVW